MRYSPSDGSAAASARCISLVLCALALASCGSGGPARGAPDPQGPGVVQADVVEEHAAQFDDTLENRPAGSQQEFAGATYILAHLQTAGYVPLLDPVPVKDLVRSTNVVAAPPRGEEPRAVITVAYDTGRDAKATGAALGTWLELARALYARDQDHAVEFVALGAENTQLNDGNLGSRRLVEFLNADDLSPLVISLESITMGGESFGAVGVGGEELTATAARLGVEEEPAPEPDDTALVFARAGIPVITVAGSVEGVARVLLEHLASGSGTPSAT